MFNCAEQGQKQKHKTHAHRILKAAGFQTSMLKHPVKQLKENKIIPKDPHYSRSRKVCYLTAGIFFLRFKKKKKKKKKKEEKEISASQVHHSSKKAGKATLP